MSEKNQQKIAIVHDWLIGGGAEKVVLALHEMYPDAPIFTSYCTDEWRKKLDNKVVTGYLQKWPFSRLRKFLPLLRILWFSHIDLSEFNLVISSSGNGEAFGIKTFGETKHVCYCHSPSHFLWRHYEQYLKQPGFGFLNPVARLGLKILVGPLRKWDKSASKNPDQFIANSTHIQKDIKKYYGRESKVVHPPVYLEKFAKVSATKKQGFVIVGRQVPYKKIDLAIMACNNLNLPLTVVGDGPIHRKLVKIAGPTIRFVANADDKQVAEHMASAEGLIFPSEEDFGITPVEAMAAGTPVIAYKSGGALDYVENKKNGIFFNEQSVASLVKALDNFKPSEFSTNKIKDSAKKFSQQRFKVEFQKALGG